MRTPRTVSALLLLALPAGAARAEPSAQLAQLREEVRQLASTYCGKCHASTSAKALPKALLAFDTVRTDWTASLSDKQLGVVIDRFKGLSPAAVPRVTEFVEAELADRKSRAPPSH